MKFYSISTERANISGLLFRDTVTIGGNRREVRLRFGDAAPVFWKAWKEIEAGTEEDQKAAYSSLAALLFGEDSAGIAAAEGEAVFFVWLYHYAKNRVFPFMLACSEVVKLVYMRAAVCSHTPLFRPFHAARLRLRMAAALAKARKYQ